MSKIFLRHTLTKKLFTFLTLYLYTFSLYENASLIIFSAETNIFRQDIGVVIIGREYIEDNNGDVFMFTM